MWSYSLDLRERIVAACREGQSVPEVARRFDVNERTVRRYKARAAQGSLEPNRIPGRPPLLQPEQEGEFVAMVQEHPDFTLEQFCQEWERRSGVLLPRSTLHGHLQRLNGRFKKDSRRPGTL